MSSSSSSGAASAARESDGAGANGFGRAAFAANGIRGGLRRGLRHGAAGAAAAARAAATGAGGAAGAAATGAGGAAGAAGLRASLAHRPVGHADARPTERDRVARSELGLADLLPVHEGARRGAEIHDHDFAGSGHLDVRMHPGHAVVVHAQVARRQLADLDDVLGELFRSHERVARVDVERELHFRVALRHRCLQRRSLA